MRSMTILESLINYSPEHKENWRMAMLKGNFEPKEQVKPEETVPDQKAEYRKRALESIGGSMVFVDRETLTYDSDEVR